MLAVTGLASTLNSDALVDIDNDGRLDLLAGIHSGGQPWRIMVARNVSGRTWSTLTQVTLQAASTLAMPSGDVDVDGDGNPDVVALLSGGEIPTGTYLAVATGNGDGTFDAPAIVSHADLPPGTRPKNDLDAGDLDGDGDVDLVATLQSGIGVPGSAWALDGNGSGSFGPAEQFFADTYFHDELVDLDDDGHLDFVVESAGHGLEVHRGVGDGTFEERRNFSGGEPELASFVTADLDDDGTLEVVSARTVTNAPNFGVTVHRQGVGLSGGGAPNLVVDTVTAPATAQPGATGTVQVTIRNAGTATAPAGWSDGIWLSADTAWDIGDRLLTTVVRADPLPAGQSYTLSVPLPFDPVRSGEHHVVARADAARQRRRVQRSGQLAPVGDGDDRHPRAQRRCDAADHRRVRAQWVRADPCSRPGKRCASASPARRATSPTSTSSATGCPCPCRELKLGDIDEATRALALPAGGAGVWFVRIGGLPAAGAGQLVTLSASALTFGIIDVSPSRGSNRGSVTIGVEGAGLSDTTSVTLERTGVSLAATDAVHPSDRQIFATFDLTGATVGTYDVVIDNGVAEARLADGFTVNNEAAGGFTYFVDVPGRIRGGATFTVRVDWRNDGDTDVVVPYLRIESERMVAGTATDGGVRMDPDRDGVFDATTAYLTPTVEGAPGWVLPAGAVGRIEVAARAVSSPYGITTGVFQSGQADQWRSSADAASLVPAGLPAAAQVAVIDQVVASWGGGTTPNPCADGVSWDLLPGLHDSLADTLPACSEKVGTIGGYVDGLGDAAREAASFGIDLPTELERRRWIVDRALATASGAALAGTVTDRLTGDPIPMPPVTAVGVADNSTVAAFSWWDGRYNLFTLPQSPWELFVDGYSPQPAATSAEVTTANASHFDVEVDSVAITGTVQRADTSAPLAGALVSAIDVGSGAQLDATTNADGEFSLHAAPDSRALVSVAAPGFVAQHDIVVDVAAVAPAPLDVQLAPGGSATGTVTDGGSGVVATVTFLPTQPGADPLETTSAPSGGFSLAGLAAGTYDVVATTGPRYAELHGVVITGGATTNGVALALAAAASVSGVVSDAQSGAPIAGATVWSSNAAAATAQTDSAADGAYALHGLAPGNSDVVVTADGYRPRRVPVLLAAGGTAVQNLVLERTGTVAGRVIDGQGQPIAGLLVELHAGIDNDVGFPAATVPLPASPMATGGSRTPTPRRARSPWSSTASSASRSCSQPVRRRTS